MGSGPVAKTEKFSKCPSICLIKPPKRLIQKYFPTKKRPRETHGPIPKAYITVPIPTIPPKYQPSAKALNSITVLIREIDESFTNFLNKNNLNRKAKIFLSGRNSQHENLVEILGKSLKMDVSVISPINNYLLKEFSYNPDEINHFARSF